MNERYLFRGQRVDTKEWVYGYLLPKFDGVYIDLCESFENDGHTSISVIQVIPESIGKCMGQKDKNKKLIFEGDILKTDCGIISIVKYGTITHKVASKLDNGELRNVDITGFYYEVSGENVFMRNELKTSDDCTIIGNVFEKEKSNFGYSLPERKA